LEFFSWEAGPIKKTLPDFRVCRVAPCKLDAWIYVTSGASGNKINDEPAIEFILMAPQHDPIHIETLAIISHYHSTLKDGLGVGHILNGGRPWLGKSKCDHFLVSLPYPFGPNLEWCRADSKKPIRFLWLLPITNTERVYALDHGIEALEERFDDAQIDSINPERKAVA
jgi:hypothetical protein